MADVNLISFPPVGMLPSLGMIDEATTDSPLGFKDRYTLNDFSLMGAGDILLLHTDGLAEHRHGEQDYFPNRVEQTVRRVKDGPARDLRGGQGRPRRVRRACRRHADAATGNARRLGRNAAEGVAGLGAVLWLWSGAFFSAEVSQKYRSRLAQRCRSTMSLILMLRSGGSSRGNVSQPGTDGARLDAWPQGGSESSDSALLGRLARRAARPSALAPFRWFTRALRL